MRGRKPTPTALKLIRGEEERRINRDEPKIAKGIGTAPDWLDDLARKEWFQIVPQLEASGMLTQVDTNSLAAYCQVISRLAQAEAYIKENGMFDERGKRNDAQITAEKCWQAMLKFSSEYGLTPASRARIKVGEPAKNDDPMEDFLKAKQQA